MRLGIVGGRLQGTEAAYLAGKAGWETVLFDKDSTAPAVNLCDSFCNIDLTQEKNLSRTFDNVDLVLPALENNNVLSLLHRWSRQTGKPLAYDPSAYAVSSSKIHSNKLFAETGVPHPRPWPECSFPIIVKASQGSGSDNVHLVQSLSDLERLTANREMEWVIQEWIKGPSFSLEVLGTTHGCHTFQVTALEMDATYDCKRVMAPAILDRHIRRHFEKITSSLCRSINLAGIMDVEIIVNEDKVKVLEIDARLPSQTPTVVYLSTGINLLELLGKITISPNTELPQGLPREEKGVIYEHIHVTPGSLDVTGEHIMAEYGPLTLMGDFYGADEAITSYSPSSSRWVATLMFTGKNLNEAQEKRETVIADIKKCHKISHYSDLYPPVIPHLEKQVPPKGFYK